MLRAPLSRRRAIWPIWSSRESIPRARSHGGANRAQPLSSNTRKYGRERRPSKDTKAGTDTKPTESRKPSLIEQLFPEETKRYEEVAARQEREIPRMPLEMPAPPKQTPADRLALPPRARESRGAMLKRRTMELQSEKAEGQTSVLVLLNASKNLTKEDFTRLIPQGQHIEGWTLEEGDIVKVIPGRNLATLEQENFYYLLFSSPLSAFVYQGHATRIARLAAEQTPDSLHTALAPTPGYMVDGVDVYAAIQAYTLTPSTQTLNLRQLKPPMSPLVESIVRNGGYTAILNRPDKMPFEVRLTLEGPQLPMSRVRYILYESGRDRALGWSGGDESNIKITKYEPRSPESPKCENDEGASVAWSPAEQSQLSFDMSRSRVTQPGSDASDDALKRRKAHPVYILGFHTEHAAQSFIRYWHRKPMDWGSKKADPEDDLAPIANAELLW
ncbi:hypothetical protein Q7P35_006392 [Cladosporium inversicolor]